VGNSEEVELLTMRGSHNTVREGGNFQRYADHTKSLQKKENQKKKKGKGHSARLLNCTRGNFGKTSEIEKGARVKEKKDMPNIAIGGVDHHLKKRKESREVSKAMS